MLQRIDHILHRAPLSPNVKYNKGGGGERGGTSKSFQLFWNQRETLTEMRNVIVYWKLKPAAEQNRNNIQLCKYW